MQQKIMHKKNFKTYLKNDIELKIKLNYHTQLSLTKLSGVMNQLDAPSEFFDGWFISWALNHLCILP